MPVPEYDNSPEQFHAVAQLVVRALRAKHTCVYSMCVTDGGNLKQTAWTLCTMHKDHQGWFKMADMVEKDMGLTMLHAVRLCSLDDFIIQQGLQETDDGC